MKMSTIKVVTMKHDIIFGQQPDTVAISVPVFEINYKTKNTTKKTAQGHANKVITNRLHRAKETKIIPTDIEMNTDKNQQTHTLKGNSKYTDSGQIIGVHKARESKKRMIQSARKGQREQKNMLQSIFAQSEPLSLTDFYEPDMNHILSVIPQESLKQAVNRLQNQAQQRHFDNLFRSLYYPKARTK